jgi:hypothetical protein
MEWIEKIVKRDANGFIASIVDRPMSATEIAATLVYTEIEAISMRGAQPGATPFLWIDPAAFHPAVDHRELLALVGRRGADDRELWKRSKWKSCRFQIGRPGPSPTRAPLPSPVKDVTPRQSYDGPPSFRNGHSA